MKKALSILLALCMLLTISAVPAWAEDEANLPVIEEITEEELAEILPEETFEEEVELFAENATSIANITYGTYVAEEGDGVTYLTELAGAEVTEIAGKSQGRIASVYNGIYTEGVKVAPGDLGEGEDIVTSNNEYPTINGEVEGYMGYKVSAENATTVLIDLGESEELPAFSGIRLVDDAKSRGMQDRKAKTLNIWASNDNEVWVKLDQATIERTAEDTYGDFYFVEGRNNVNLAARYIKFDVPAVFNSHGEFQIEEIVMLDANADNITRTPATDIYSNDIIESVVCGTTWGGTVANLTDKYYAGNSYWHSFADPENKEPDRVYTDEDVEVIVTFKEATEIGGLRIWPRNDGTATSVAQNGGSPLNADIYVSYDGETFKKVSTNTFSYASSYVFPADAPLPTSATVKAVKFVTTKSLSGGDKYTCFAELEILKPEKASDKSYPFGEDEFSDIDVLTDVSVSYTSDTPDTRLWNSGKSKPVTSLSDAVNARLFDRKIRSYKEETTIPHWEANGVIYPAPTDGGAPSYAWVTFDAGKEITVSALRIYSRLGWAGQEMTKGKLYVSSDNAKWYEMDLSTGSRGDRYFDASVAMASNAFNITARYFRIKNLQSGGKDTDVHWSAEEICFVKPIEGNETYTVAQLAAKLAEDAKAVEALIDEIPEVITGDYEAVAAAKNAYDALPDDAKELVSEEKLSKLEAAEAAVAGFVFELPLAQNTGLKKATFTLPVRDETRIKSVTYIDTFGNVKDGTSATTVAVDGDNMTITMAGNYVGGTGLTGYSDGTTTYIHNDTSTTYGWTMGDQVKPEFFTGIFVREVASDGFGDHFIDITFEDDVTYTVNIKTTPVWTTLTGAQAISGTEYTDEITPKTTWKTTTTAMGASMAGAFNGKIEYLIRKGGDTKTTDRYESDYIAGKLLKADDNTTVTQVIMYKPVRTDFVVDTGEATTVSGIRIYPRVSGYNDDKTKGTSAGCPSSIRYWGSNNGIDWTVLGDYTFTQDNIVEKTADFGKNVSYRYYKGSVLKVKGLEYKQTISISELTFIQPKTHLVSEANVIVDKSEGKDVSFQFILAGGENITSFTTDKGVNVPHKVSVSGKQALIKIEAASLATLSNGTHNLTLVLTNGQSFELSLVVNDYSKATYILSDATGRGTEALVLTSTRGKAVTGITVDGVAVTPYTYSAGEMPAYTVSEDNTEITIPRYNFRKLVDLYAKLGLHTDGTAEVVVTYDDATTKTYTVTITANWLETPARNGAFADDEIIPVAGEWKVRTSSANNENAHPKFAFVEVLRNARDSQNWHSAYTHVTGPGAMPDTAMDHYIDVDFGENAPEFSGVRVTERLFGSTYIRITISGKNSDSDEWEEFFSGRAGAVAPEVNNLMFDKVFNYRYMRMQFDGGSPHVTVDTIHLIKDLARLEGDATAVVDTTEAEDAVFTFYMPEGAAGAVSVANGETAVDAANYTFVDGVLTIKADYVATLGVSTTLTVTIDGVVFDLKINKQDKYSATYVISGGENGRGTDDLVLYTPAGKTPTGITYGDKTIAVDPEKAPVELVAGDGTLTVKRYVIRNLDDLFDKTEIKLTVNFSDETSKEYTVALSKEGKVLTGINTEAFAADEIIPAEGAWTITASASNNAGEHVNFAFANRGGVKYNWHSAFTETSKGVATVDATTNRLYIDVDFGAATEIAGLRYYEREESDSGLWNGASVYGKDASGNWVLIKSQAFDVAALKSAAAGTAEINFTEKVTYQVVRIIIDASNLSTAKAITFLNTIPAPEVSEEEVNIKVTPTTGGNVYIVKGETETPSLGDNVVSANTEVTFKVGNSDQSFFQYWIEANTGKILGNDPSLSVQTTVGKDIKAVFADPASFEVFVSFFGRNGKNILSHSYVQKGKAPKAPSLEKLYTTGYEFVKWVDKDGNALDATAVVNANTEFYAEYQAKAAKKSTITVTNGTVAQVGGGVAGTTEGTFAYDTKVIVEANEAAAGQKFSHWTIDGVTVSYANPYTFFAPDKNIALVANYVAEDAVVEKAVTITMTQTTDVTNGVNVAGFLTTRYVPAGVTVLETGVIYVKDATDANGAEYTNATLTIAAVGTTSQNGKVVKTALSEKTGTGQYKLSASYYDMGIAARGFITYLDADDNVQTAYTDVVIVKNN